MSLISVRGLGHGFAGRTLFQNLQFGLNEGDRAGLLGPNGAGKSTLVKILNQKIKADHGEVVHRRGLRIGFLDQDPVFDMDATILDTLIKDSDADDGGYTRAFELIALMGLTRFEDSTTVAQLSGGWRKRLALARELMKDPELLILDEPTNHLDVSSVQWLEDFLAESRLTQLIVTHDRLFLQRVTTRILDLDPRYKGGLLDFKGDYAEYLIAREQIVAGQRQREKALKNTLRRETEWLRRGAQARQTKQQARIQGAAVLKEEVQNLSERNRVNVSGISFGENEKNPERLIAAENVGHSFDGENFLYRNLELLITPRTRLAFLGDNGSGKSTLLRSLIGEIEPSEGRIKILDGLKFAYFEQTRDRLDPEKSVLQNIAPGGDYVNFQGTFVHVRSYLDRFLFYGQRAELPVAKLSGGEKARLRIAQLMLEPAQVLVLDEPTNDLDLETLEVLEESLANFRGAILLVTHDRYFMDAVCDKILAFPIDGGTELVQFSSYFQWEEWIQVQTEELRQKAKKAAAATSAAAPKAKMSFKEKKEFAEIEGSISALETAIADLTTRLQAPEVLSNHAELRKLGDELAKKERELENKFARWQELEQKAKNQP